MPDKQHSSQPLNHKLQTANCKPVLLISASDSSGAAGMAVDIRVANDLGYPVRCALTAVTVQGEKGLVSAFPVDPSNVAEAVTTANSDPADIGAVKIGLITAPEVAQAVSTAVVPLHKSGIPIILDPVMRSTPGSPLASTEVKKAVFQHLLPVTTVVTPNRDELDELAVMAGLENREEEKKATTLISRGTGAVLVTGGDDDSSMCIDTLYRDGEDHHLFRHEKIGKGSTRGTGCSLSTALAVHLAKGLNLLEAIESSISYVTAKIRSADMVGSQRLLFPGKKHS